MNIVLDGAQLFDWRRARYLTAAEAAEKADVSLGTWLRLENNKGAVRLRTARRIARVMGVEEGDLLLLAEER
jgi:transcriptional regulator with XRE-family HTH domain